MDKSPREQVVEHLQTANNVLVTLKRNPSVDQLAACIGLTLMLNKTGKHATAVFSGQVPSTIEFLQPEKTLQKTTDSLRDFIIALDKSKADKLRYKVEDQLVKIFITPYRTTISQKDLEFSQGDFNVDVVMALGVHEKEDLDQAIITHGRILHDATVVSVNNVDNPSLGNINWVDTKASSLCEMIASVSQDINKNILDNQIATAFLTGIVAETNRFSNAKVNPTTMSLAGVLMAAGANSQLVATKLEQGQVQPAAPAPKRQTPPKPNGELDIVHDEPAPKPEPVKPPPKRPTDTLDYGLHGEPPTPDEINIDEQGQLTSDNASRQMAEPPKISPAATLSTGDEQEVKNEDVDTLPPPVVATPILTHDTPSSEPTPAPAPAPEPVAPPLEEKPVTPIEEPTIRDEQTLTDIEEAVKSPHLDPPTPIAEAPPTPTVEDQLPEPTSLAANDTVVAPSTHLENARAQVQQAFSATGPAPDIANAAKILDANANITPPPTVITPSNRGPTVTPLGNNLPANLVPPLQPATNAQDPNATPPQGPPPMMPPPIYPTT